MFVILFVAVILTGWVVTLGQEHQHPWELVRNAESQPHPRFAGSETLGEGGARPSAFTISMILTWFENLWPFGTCVHFKG